LRAADALDRASGRADPLVPPRRLWFVGDSDFRATGEEFRAHFQTFGDLASQDRVLDIGCGIGRMARVLVDQLAPPRGSYDGFDVSRVGVDWCRSRYGDAPVPFRFTQLDLHHPEYNPGGTGDAASCVFPYPDASFDLAIATSVFTHLLDDAVDRYLSEVGRVLAPGGRLFATWIALDPARPPVRSRAVAAFAPTTGVAWVGDPAAPEAIVAYPLEWIGSRLRAHGLVLREPYQPGTWRGRDGVSFQDILVADLADIAEVASEV
jgi:SAM-dependent methyltransferase